VVVIFLNIHIAAIFLVDGKYFLPNVEIINKLLPTRQDKIPTLVISAQRIITSSYNTDSYNFAIYN